MTTMTTRRPANARRFRADERGAALLEFALIATVLLILVFGIIDFGRMLYTKNTLTNAAREGGRVAAVMQAPLDVDSIKRTVVHATNLLGGTALSQDSVHVTLLPDAGPLQSIQVTVNYPYEPITPIASLIGLDSLTLSGSARFRWELGG